MDAPPVTPVFLLSQLGTHATMLLSERIAELGLTLPQSAMLYAIADREGTSQQALAQALGMLPSRIVAFIDDLEGKDLVRRERHVTDRRTYALRLTDNGVEKITAMQEAIYKNSDDVLSALTDEERETLGVLLRKLVAGQGLAPRVHPGMRTL